MAPNPALPTFHRHRQTHRRKQTRRKQTHQQQTGRKQTHRSRLSVRVVCAVVAMAALGLGGQVAAQPGGPWSEDARSPQRSAQRFDPRSARCDTDDSNPHHRPWPHPVEAAIVDWFRPPSNPYGPGNRGLEYGTVGGEQVSAVASGSVVFAGPVGGSRFLVVVEPNGLRITYAYLEAIEVAVGDELDRGQPVATAAQGLHLTVRDRGHYVDPLPLMVGYRCFEVRLVPVPGEP